MAEKKKKTREDLEIDIIFTKVGNKN